MIDEIFRIPYYFYRISVKALILDDKKRFLLVLEDKGLWELPGGGLKYGEKISGCLTREIKEEMGLEVTYVDKFPSYNIIAKNQFGKWWNCNLIYRVQVRNFNFTPSQECVKLKFFNKNEALKENLFSNVKEFLKIYDPNKHTD